MKTLKKELLITAATALFTVGSAMAAQDFTALRGVAAEQMSGTDMAAAEGKFLINFDVPTGTLVFAPFLGPGVTVRLGLTPGPVSIGVCAGFFNGLC